MINIMLLVSFLCCGQHKEKTELKDQPKEEVQPKKFEMVTIPSFITERSERASYAVNHYWDEFDFADTTNVHLPEYTEQALCDFLEVLNHVDENVAKEGIHNMLRQAEKDTIVYAYFTKQCEKYLYEPNSPMKNENHFIYALEAITESQMVSETDKIRPRALLELALKNRVGNTANDFAFVTIDGKQSRLSAVKADRLVLLFYNPDCDNCRKTMGRMKISDALNKVVEDGSVKVLAIYPEQDEQLWKDSAGNLPAAWINGFDKEGIIDAEELYDLGSMPSLYLLDKDKKVIVKDASFDEIEKAIVG
jgi:thiol-disulfide isomerase/thioredoxin